VKRPVKDARWCIVNMLFTMSVSSLALAMVVSFTPGDPKASDKATLQISIEKGASKGLRGKFEFFDVSEGCPEEYVDLPGAKGFLGIARKSDKGVDKQLPVGHPVHITLVGRGDMKDIIAGGTPELRRRSLQVVLEGDATLRYLGFEDHVPVWEASGPIEVESATACESDDDEPAMDAENESEESAGSGG
jgi:hypothetical protein